MNVEAPENTQSLRAQLARASEKRDALERELYGIDAELAGLASEQRQHRLLRTVCDALDELGAQGADGLFWGARGEEGHGERHVHLVRGRVDAFEKRHREIEERREAIADALDQQQQVVEILEDDVFEVQRREEERRLEWVVEREVDAFPLRASVMPWARGGEDDTRFRQLLALTVLYSVLLALLLPLVQLPLPEPWTPAEVPERLTRLIQEVHPLPARPLTRPETRRERAEPRPTDETPPLARNDEPASPESPPQKAGSKGILAFREQLSELATNRPIDRLGAQARIRGSGGAASGQPERSLLTSQAPGSSGGIKLSALSRDVGGGGGGIDGVQVGRVASSIGSAGSSRGSRGSDTSGRAGPSLGRTDEEIQIVFDRHKAALYRLYNRELRTDPTLQGQMVLRIRIEPDGSVSLCELQASDMKAPELAEQVLARVRTFDFGAKEGIPAITILYPIDFLPAT